MDPTDLHSRLLRWYADHARDLPWRRPGTTPWGVLVSEIMLQQTPVPRVAPVWEAWLQRWPEPADLVEAGAGEAVRAWGRLGYPRRALRLHAAAATIVEQHDGVVPDRYEDLLALPGIGDYTAAAVASFAYGHRHVVLDTNVRRVLTRLVAGEELPPASLNKPERERAAALLPDDEADAAGWAIATMELGAVVCTSASPSCSVCPVADVCAWRLAGSPPDAGPPRRGQTYAGTDRQCRGRLLDVLRDADTVVHRASLTAVWSGGLRDEQRERCLASLLADGLVTQVGPDTFALPA
ncbi:A/G-specific adenine glycosylase [Nocardioides sp. HDW12B]|uniref:A/G-specific adenine glycosylase n=1 Tax=Nocardioides sp. HDW12B TaxID=2714939 RepID=UPI0014085B63|nr:A/G-specific adenine glycosylase [Nocardioides sp. HDW12B]QIK65108.1 A/G-specific adenine glycosylase [Nocardioides sp. HDW12B]